MPLKLSILLILFFILLQDSGYLTTDIKLQKWNYDMLKEHYHSILSRHVWQDNNAAGFKSTLKWQNRNGNWKGHVCMGWHSTQSGYYLITRSYAGYRVPVDWNIRKYSTDMSEDQKVFQGITESGGLHDWTPLFLVVKSSWDSLLC